MMSVLAQFGPPLLFTVGLGWVLLWQLRRDRAHERRAPRAQPGVDQSPAPSPPEDDAARASGSNSRSTSS